MGVGIGGQTIFGLGEESSYGTAVAPTRFHEISSESLELKLNKISSTAIRPGGYNPKLGSREIISSREATGDFKIDVTTKSLGLLLKHIMGPALSPTIVQQGSTTAYLQTFLLGLSGGKSLTLQKQIRDNAGNVIQAFDYPGSKIVKADFAVSDKSMLEVTCSVDARDEVQQGSPAAASYGTVKPFYFAQGLVKVNGSQVTDVITAANVSLERPMNTARYGLGNQGRKSEQVENDFPKISGKMSSEFTNITNYGYFTNATPLSFVLEFNGATIASPYVETFRITIPEIHLDGESPKVGGGDEISINMPFNGWFDGTNPAMKIEYITTDTAL